MIELSDGQETLLTIFSVFLAGGIIVFLNLIYGISIWIMAIPVIIFYSIIIIFSKENFRAIYIILSVISFFMVLLYLMFKYFLVI